MNNGLIRAVASAVITDLAATAAGTVVVAAAVSFIPGVGSMAASTLSAISTFGYVYLAGIIFIKLLVAMGVFRVEEMSEAEIREKAKEVREGMNMKDAMKEVRTVYKKRS